MRAERKVRRSLCKLYLLHRGRKLNKAVSCINGKVKIHQINWSVVKETVGCGDFK